MRSLLCFVSLGLACVCSGLSLNGAMVSASNRVAVSQPAGVADAQTTLVETLTLTPEDISVETATNNYSLVFFPEMDVGFGEYGDPALPAKEIRFELPKGAKVSKVTVDATWTTYSTNLLIEPMQEPHIVSSEEVPFTPPNATTYALTTPYPAQPYVQFPTIKAGPKTFLPVRIIPFRYTPATRLLELATSMTVTVTVTVPKKQASKSLTAKSRTATAPEQVADYIVISPENYVEDWQKYIVRRKQRFPNMTFAVKNASEIYTEYKDYDYNLEAVDSTSTGPKPRNEVEMIHAYIKTMYNRRLAQNPDAGTMYIMLGGPNGSASRTLASGEGKTSLKNSIPTCLARSCSNDSTIMSDLFFACLDNNKEGSDYPYPWNENGILQGDGTAGNYPVYIYGQDPALTDTAPDVAVGRLTALPADYDGTGAKNWTIPKLIEAYADKLDRGEDPNFAGRFRTAHSGNKLHRQFKKTEIRDDTRYEYEFFDEGANMWEANHSDLIYDTEYCARLRGLNFVSYFRPVLGGTGFVGGNPVNAEEKVYEYADDMAHGAAWSSMTPITADELSRSTGLVKIYAMQVPCHLGCMSMSGNCVGEAGPNNPRGGSLVSYANSNYGWSGYSYGESSLSYGMHLRMMEALFEMNCTAGEAWMHAANVNFTSLGNRGIDCHIQVILFGDPLVSIAPVANYTWAGDKSGSADWNFTSTSWTNTDTNASATYDHAANVTFAPTGDLTMNVSTLTNRTGMLTLTVNQPATATFTLSGDKIVKVMNGLTVSQGNLHFAVPGGVGGPGGQNGYSNGSYGMNRTGITFTTKGNLTISNPTSSRSYFGKINNADTVTVASANTVLDLGTASANTMGFDTLIFEGTSAAGNPGNVLRSRTGGLLKDYKTIPVKNIDLALQTVNVGGTGTFANTPANYLFAVENGILRIQRNPMLATENFTRPISLKGGTLRSEYASFALGATANTPGYDLNVFASTTDSTLEDNGVGIPVNGELRIHTEAGATLINTASLRDGTTKTSIVVDGAGTFEMTTASTISGDITVKAGTLRVSHAKALGSGSITVESGATLQLATLPLVGINTLTLKSGAKLILNGVNDSVYTILDPRSNSTFIHEVGSTIYDRSAPTTALNGISLEQGFFIVTSNLLLWKGDASANGTWSIYGASNWTYTYLDYATPYPNNDTMVLFNSIDGITNATITLTESLSPKKLVFNNQDTVYTFNGEGFTLSSGSMQLVASTTFNLPVNLSGDVSVLSGTNTFATLTTTAVSIDAGATFGVTGALTAAANTTSSVTIVPGGALSTSGIFTNVVLTLRGNSRIIANSDSPLTLGEGCTLILTEENNDGDKQTDKVIVDATGMIKSTDPQLVLAGANLTQDDIFRFTTTSAANGTSSATEVLKIIDGNLYAITLGVKEGPYYRQLFAGTNDWDSAIDPNDVTKNWNYGYYANDPFTNRWSETSVDVNAYVLLDPRGTSTLTLDLPIQMNTLYINPTETMTKFTIEPTSPNASLQARTINGLNCFGEVVINMPAGTADVYAATKMTMAGGSGSLAFAQENSVFTTTKPWTGTLTNIYAAQGAPGTLIHTGDQTNGYLRTNFKQILRATSMSMTGDFDWAGSTLTFDQNATFTLAGTLRQTTANTITIDASSVTVDNFALATENIAPTLTLQNGGTLIVKDKFDAALAIGSAVPNYTLGANSTLKVGTLTTSSTNVLLAEGDTGTETELTIPITLNDGGTLRIGAGGITREVTAGEKYHGFTFNMSNGVLAADADWMIHDKTLASIVIAANKTATFLPNGHTITYSQIISGAGALVLDGTSAPGGTVVLSAANTYTGGTTINNATLKVTGAKALGETSGVTLNGGATLDITEYTGTPPSISPASGSTVKSVITQRPTFMAIEGVRFETTLTAEQCLQPIAVTVAHVPAGTDTTRMTVVVRSPEGAQLTVTTSVNGTELQVTPVLPPRTLSFTPTAATSNLTWNMITESFLNEETSVMTVFSDRDTVKFLTGEPSIVTLNSTLKPGAMEIGGGFTFTGIGTIDTPALTKVGSGSSTVDVSIVAPVSVEGGTLTLALRKTYYRYVRWNVTATRPTGDHTNSGMQISEFSLYNGDTKLTLSTNMVLRTGVKTANIPDGQFIKGEKVANLFDNKTNTKWYFGGSEGANTLLTGDGIHLVLDLGEAPQTITGFRFTTANDANGRDPYTWTLEVSANGSTWTTLYSMNEQPALTRTTETVCYTLTPPPQITGNISVATGATLEVLTATTVSGDVTFANGATFKVGPNGRLTVANAAFTGSGIQIDASAISVGQTPVAILDASGITAEQFVVPAGVVRYVETNVLYLVQAAPLKSDDAHDEVQEADKTIVQNLFHAEKQTNANLPPVIELRGTAHPGAHPEISKSLTPAEAAEAVNLLGITPVFSVSNDTTIATVDYGFGYSDMTLGETDGGDTTIIFKHTLHSVANKDTGAIAGVLVVQERNADGSWTDLKVLPAPTFTKDGDDWHYTTEPVAIPANPNASNARVFRTIIRRQNAQP